MENPTNQDSLLSDLKKNKSKKTRKGSKKKLVERLMSQMDSSTDSLYVTDSLQRKKNFWKPRIKYGLSLSFDMARGNTNYMSLVPKTDVFLDVGILGVQTSLGYNLTKVNGSLVNRDFLLNMMPTVLLGEKIYLNGLIGAQAASTRNISQRQRRGVGFGVPFQKDNNKRLGANLNGVQETTEYMPDENGKMALSNGGLDPMRQTYGIQLGSNGQLELGKTGLGINYDTFFMKSLNVKEDFRIGVILDFLVPISKKIWFQTHLNYSYENIILIGTKHQDVFVTFGIGYREL